MNETLLKKLVDAYDLNQKDRTYYQVNELFDTVQGEGLLVGVPATFIRLQGCPVGCPWCDTKYTWAATASSGELGTRLTIPEIVEQVHHKHVVITGGEPLIWDLDNLLMALFKTHHYVQIETSGAFRFLGQLKPDYITVSPKRDADFAREVELRDIDEVKFVCDELLLPYEVEEYCDGYHGDIVIMAEGCPPSKESTERAIAIVNQVQKPKVRYGDRLQYRIGVR